MSGDDSSQPEEVRLLSAEVERLQQELADARAGQRRWQERFLAAAHELTKEITDSRDLSFGEARLVARDLIATNYRLRTRPAGDE